MITSNMISGDWQQHLLRRIAQPLPGWDAQRRMAPRPGEERSRLPTDTSGVKLSAVLALLPAARLDALAVAPALAADLLAAPPPSAAGGQLGIDALVAIKTLQRHALVAHSSAAAEFVGGGGPVNAAAPARSGARR